MRMLKNDLNLEVTRGDTFSFGVEIDALGQELEAAYFTCKNNYDDQTYLFQKTLSDGITLDRVEGNNYFYKLRLAPQDTISLEAGEYYYDFQIEANGDVFTILKGVLTLSFDVTERSGAPVPEIIKVDWGNIEGDIGNQTDLMNELNSKANAAHTHVMSDIISGILPIALGGTGAGTVNEARSNLDLFEAGIIVGDGQSSKTHTFDFEPKFVFVFMQNQPFLKYSSSGNYTLCNCGVAMGTFGTVGMSLNRNELTLTQYSTASNNVYVNLNGTNSKYICIAFK